MESAATLQRGQEVSDMKGNNWLNRSLVGRMFQAIFHKNNLSLSLRFSFHNDFQQREERSMLGRMEEHVEIK